jgi:hypothetical protein
LEEQSRHFTLRRRLYINLRLRPQTYDLHTTSTLRNITSNPSQKTLQNLYNSVFTANTTLLRRTTTFLLQFHRILLDYSIFSYTSLSGITTKTHFTPDSTKETPEKSRIDTSLRARALLLYDLLSSLLIRQNKTHLTSFHSLLVYLQLDRIAYAKPESLHDNRQSSLYD